MTSLAAKRVLITGGGSGIGRSLAHRFAGAGAEVVVCDIDASAAREVRARITARGGRACAVTADVTDASSIARARQQVLAEAGPIDVLVNNAGIVHGGPFLQVPLSRHLATYHVNTLAVVAVTHAFLPDLLARPEAHLVNIASASGFVGLPYGSTYASSKWAVIGFSESIRMELASLGHAHVRVTTVCPSYVRTGMFDGVRAPRLTRMLTPERVADLVVRAVLKKRAFVLAPWIVGVTPLLNAILPRPVFDAVARAFGVNTSMASWRGRPQL
ncbi:MAG: SDR family NAD(P)-dependent oxidoreductase [Acidobacteria bacterium]|nr:SDR family NAD(P)-dependent oxidoreductase [Acidobacteriota bacterium]